MAELISFEEDQAQEPVISFEQGEGAPLLPPDDAKNRSVKHHLALGKDSPGVQSILSTLDQGREYLLRQAASESERIKKLQIKADILQDYVKNRPEGAEPVPGEYEFLQSLSTEELMEPSTILERKFAEWSVNSALTSDRNKHAEDAQKEDVEAFDKDADAAESIITTQQLAMRIGQDLSANTGLWDYAKTFVPLYENIQSRAVDAPDSNYTSSLLMGENRQEQLRDFWMRSPKDRDAYLLDLEQKGMRKEINPAIVSTFVKDVVEFSKAAKFMSNMSSVLDVADVATLGGAAAVAGVIKGGSRVAKGVSNAAKGAEKLLKEGVQFSTKADKGKFVRETVDPKTGVRTSEVVDDTAVNRTRGVLDATIESTANNQLDTVTVPESLGDFETAAVEAILRDSREAVSGQALGFDIEITRNTRSFFDPRIVTNNAGRWIQSAKKQMEDTLAGSRNLMLRTLLSGEGATSLTREQIENAMPMLKDEMRRRFQTADNAVLDADWRVIYEADNIAGRNQIEVPLGRTDGTLFADADEARLAARELYGLRDGAYEGPIQKGGGYFIRVAKDIDVTTNAFRDLLIDSDNVSPESAAATFMQYLVGGNTYMSEVNRANRRIAAHQVSRIHALLKEAAESIGTVTKAEHRNLDSFLATYRDKEFGVPGDRDYKRGVWFKNVNDFELAWKQLYNDFPSEKVTTAYFTYKQAMDFQYLVTNLRTVRDKARVGMVNVEFSIPVEEVVNGETKRSMRAMHKPIEGRLVDSPLPDKRVLIIDNEKMEPIYVDMKRDGTSMLDDYAGKGYRYVQIVNPGAMPMKAVTQTEDVVNYVLVRDVRESALPMMQIPYQEGGHVGLNLQFSLKQPIFKTTPNGDKIYRGDRFISAHSSEAEAKKWWERFETARKMLVAGDVDGLKKYLPVHTPWKSIDDFRAQFEPRSPRFLGDTDTDPLFDLNTPAGYVADRQGINDAAKTHLRDQYAGYFDNVLDTVDDETNLYRILDKEFTGEKSPVAYTIEGEEGAWGFAKARHINPMAMMQESLSTTARNLALDNVQTQFVETWIQESKDLLDVPIEKLRQDPYEHLMNPKWNRYADPKRLGVAQAKRLAAMQFLGLRNPTNKAMDLVRNRLLNTVYNKGGKKATEWVDDHLLPLVKDPSQYIRAAAFHPTMGFFNPAQILLQGMTLFHGIAITGNPARAGTALAGSVMMSMSRLTFNEDVIRGIAKKAAKLGWKEDDFVEAYSIIRDQGIHIVEGEVGSLDTVFGSKLFKGKAGEWLDKGTLFFKETERLIRLNAFNIAYREFRNANPTKKITNTDLGRIMDRYGELSLNMVRDSNSSWQNGILSIPLQFQGFHARLMEQFLGNRLTKAEKLRVFGMYSALYGVPVGVMAGTGIPFGDDLRQAALERGIKIDEGFTDVLMNGMLSVGLEAMTGTQFAAGARLGPAGIPLVKDFLQGDKTTLELLGGPSYSIISGILGQAYPAIKDIASFDMNSLKYANFGQTFQGITTVNNATKLLYALRTGKFMNRRGELVGDMNSIEAWIMFTTGMLPQDIQDAYIKIQSMKDLSAAELELDREFKRYIGKAIQLPPGTPEREQLVEKAYTFMVDRADGETKAARLIHEVMGGMTLEENVNKRFLNKAPISQQDARSDAEQEEQE